MPEHPGPEKAITLYFDGASKGNPGPAGAGAVLLSNSHVEHEIKQFLGNATNNQAEYTALLLGLQAASRIGATHVTVCGDSELVVRQLLGTYQVKDEKLKALYAQVMEVSRTFRKVEYTHVPRERNKRADALANMAVKEGWPESRGERESNGKNATREAWVELRVGSDTLIPAIKEFLKNVLEKAGLPAHAEPAASILAAFDKASDELSGSGKGLCIRLFCDREVAHMEMETESRQPLIYQHFRIPG